MTAHVVYAAIDRPQPATTSARIVRDVTGVNWRSAVFLLTDDLSMQALERDIRQNGARAALVRPAANRVCTVTAKWTRCREVQTEVMRLQMRFL